MATDPTIVTMADLDLRGRQAITTGLYDWIFGTENDGSGRTNRNNEKGFSAIPLRPRVLRGVADRILRTEVLGQSISLPVMIAPLGLHMRVHPDGELATVKAADSIGTILVLSTSSSHSIEEVAAAAKRPHWFQLYFFKDRSITESLVHRAEVAGYGAIVLTVDNVRPSSERGDKYALGIPPQNRFSNFRGDPHIEKSLGLSDFSSPDIFAWQAQDLNWKDVEWLRSLTRLPIVIKGIQCAEDARICTDVGMAGMVVSNHGGHALSDASSTVSQLPEVVEAVQGKAEVYLDGGIRQGTDVLKALALGARAVFIGRPIFWGLAAAGEAGVHTAFEILQRELDLAMASCGVGDVRSVDRRLVRRRWAARVSPRVSDIERLVTLLEAGRLTREAFEAEKVRVLSARSSAVALER